MVDVRELSQVDQPFDLFEFSYTVGKQIENAKNLLESQWLGEIHSILLEANLKGLLPDVRRLKLIQRFYNCVAALMTQQLEDMCIRSLRTFADFICDYGKSNPGFKLSLMLEDEDVIVFNPNFSKMQSEMTRIIESILVSVKNLPRIEAKLYTDFRLTEKTYLTPAIPDSIVAETRNRICALLEEQRIGPELRLQDFDSYIDLMNGKDAEKISKFIQGNQSFEAFCDMVSQYRQKENQIARDIWGVIRIGLYEFHREKFVSNLETFASFMQEQLLTSMVDSQQNVISKLGREYDSIAKKALTLPKDTEELMKLKAYVINTEENVIPDMERKLRVNMDHILWLMDHTLYSPLQIKNNSNTFQWYLKLPSIFEEHRIIIAD